MTNIHDMLNENRYNVIWQKSNQHTYLVSVLLALVVGHT